MRPLLLLLPAILLALVACGGDDDDDDGGPPPAENRLIDGVVPPGALDSRYGGHNEFGVWSTQSDPLTGRAFRCLYNWDVSGAAGGPAMWCYEIEDVPG